MTYMYKYLKIWHLKMGYDNIIEDSYVHYNLYDDNLTFRWQNLFYMCSMKFKL